MTTGPEPSPPSGAAPAWQAQRERSTHFWLVWMVGAARHLGRPLVRWVLLPVTLYFLVTGHTPRRTAREFLTRALGRPARLRDVARNIHAFASIVLDRVFFLLDRKQDFEVRIDRSPELFEVCYERGRGALLFTSHLGSFEAMRVAASSNGPIRVLLDRVQGAKLTALLEHLSPGFASGIIDASGSGPGVVLGVKQALDENMRVGVMVDRARAGEQTVTAQFFGRPAKFPAGPWLMAAALQAPVVMVFCLYQGGNRYDAHFELFSERLVIPRARRAEELQACVQRYAARLEHYARQNPYNWFNFYDFWAP